MNLSDTDQAPYSAPVNTGGAAFPRPCGETSQGGNYEQDGVTLRDYIAAKAMQGIISNNQDFPQDLSIEDIQKHIAFSAYEFADAMLAAREVRK